VAFYRIAQEALNNILKHADAEHVTLRLTLEPMDEIDAMLPQVAKNANKALDAKIQARSAWLEITDDGRGFDMHVAKPNHFGLHIMRERAEEVGARIRVASAKGRGTRIRVIWHHDQAEEEPDEDALAIAAL
jgi:signal transduction histidine kinase